MPYAGLLAQSVAVKTDRNRVLIGEQLNYELLVGLPSPGYAVNFRFPDSIPHFDIIANNNFDTIKNNGSFYIHKRIILTSFDSGYWYIPSYEVMVENGALSRRYLTDSLPVSVGYSPADSTGRLRDIKPVMEVTVSDNTLLYIIAVVLLLAVVAWLIYRYVRNKGNKKTAASVPLLSAYEEAMNELGKLKNINLGDPAMIKKYHEAISSVFRRYFSRKTGSRVMVDTTGEMLIKIRKSMADAGTVSAVAEVLRCADAVKFAKYVPGAIESERSMEQVRAVIEQMEKISFTR